MSRNKLIKFVHDYTGMTYAKCRIICKLGHWNEFDILSYIGVDQEILKKAIETTEKAFKAIKDLGSIIWAVTTLKEMAEDCAASIRAAAAVDDHKKKLYGLNITAHFDDISFPIDVNDPNTPIFAPYYASAAGNGKLYQNDGGRNTDETGA